VDLGTPVTFRPPGGGHKGLAGTTRHGAGGVREGAATKGGARKPLSRPTDSLLPLPEPENAAIGEATDGTAGPDGPGGDPNGPGDGTTDGPASCPECPGDGPLGPGDRDRPYDQATLGLIPPTLVPGSRALPKYPDLARRAGLQGTVILLAVIEKDGSVGEIEVVKSPDQRWGFDLAAIDAVKQWRYQPALMNGGPVAAYIQVMVEFTLAR
jgi:protein TonB